MDSVRSVALGFWIGTGSVTEDEPEAGLSHLLEHMLFRGTDRYGSLEIDQLFDAMGAELNAGTGKETTSVYARVLDVHLPEAFDVMHEMVWKPRIAADDLDNERQIVLEEIAMYEDDPAGQGVRRPRRGDLRRAPAGPRGHRPRRRRGGQPGGRAEGLPRPALRSAQRRAGRGRLDRSRRARGARARGRRRGPAGRDRAARAAAARRAGGADAVHPQGHRAVPRVPRRAGHRPRRRSPLGAAGARQRARRHVVLPAVPGGARAARASPTASTRSARCTRARGRSASTSARDPTTSARPCASWAPSSSASSPTRSPPRSWPARRRTSRGARSSRWSPRPRG